MPEYIIAPVARREAVREGLLKDVAEAASLPCGEQGYVGMASVRGDGSLAPTGVGEMLQAVPERLFKNGRFVAFVVDDENGSPHEFRNAAGVLVSRPKDKAGGRHGGQNIPGL